MTTREAYRIVKDQLSECGIVVEDNEALDIIYAALKEQSERTIGCDYCNDPDIMYGAVSFPRTTDGHVDVKKMEATEANFCPICGKKLVQEAVR